VGKRKIVNVVNIAKEMRKHTHLNISYEASTEYALFVITFIETNMGKLEELAKKEKRKTILDRDVINLFSGTEVDG